MSEHHHSNKKFSVKEVSGYSSVQKNGKKPIVKKYHHKEVFDSDKKPKHNEECKSGSEENSGSDQNSGNEEETEQVKQVTKEPKLGKLKVHKKINKNEENNVFETQFCTDKEPKLNELKPHKKFKFKKFKAFKMKFSDSDSESSE